MQKVFVSSVVNGFEEYRRAARAAVELMGQRPIMCEDFGARPFSSDAACISEVEMSDIYLVVLGEKYGFTDPAGKSVTEMEYQAAKASGKVILAFVQQTEMEEQQKAFRKEVEDFTTGFFRGSFRSPEELKDGIVKALRQLNQAQQAISEEEFKSKVDRAVAEVAGYSSAPKPLLCLAFLQQPMRNIDIIAIEGKLDSIFSLLCQNGVMIMRDGYKPECRRDWTGIKAKDASVSYFDDGMILLLLSPVVRTENFFSGSFARPSRIKELATAVLPLVEATSCWAHISLSGMEHVVVREPPERNITSMAMRMYGDQEADFNELFFPITQSAYARWIERCLKRFERIFAV